MEVAREDEGDGERCSGLALRSGSGSESLSDGCSCRSFCDSLIVASSRRERTASDFLEPPTRDVSNPSNFWKSETPVGCVESSTCRIEQSVLSHPCRIRTAGHWTHTTTCTSPGRSSKSTNAAYSSYTAAAERTLDYPRLGLRIVPAFTCFQRAI